MPHLSESLKLLVVGTIVIVLIVLIEKLWFGDINLNTPLVRGGAKI